MSIPATSNSGASPVGTMVRQNYIGEEVPSRRTERTLLRFMMYFWFIPAVLLLMVCLWIFYTMGTRKNPERVDGKTIVDNPSGRRRRTSRASRT
jgi:hypothetical protein